MSRAPCITDPTLLKETLVSLFSDQLICFMVRTEKDDSDERSWFKLDETTANINDLSFRVDLISMDCGSRLHVLVRMFTRFQAWLELHLLRSLCKEAYRKKHAHSHDRQRHVGIHKSIWTSSSAPTCDFEDCSQQTRIPSAQNHTTLFSLLRAIGLRKMVQINSHQGVQSAITTPRDG